MKKILLFLLAALFAFVPMVSASAATTVTIVSWRPDAADTEQWNQIIAKYMETHPDVELMYEGISSKEYNATLRTQLETGTAADIIMARSYATGQELFSQGFFGDCSDIPNINENFAPSSLAPWQMPDGKMFAVPTAAVQQVVFYNKDYFAANNYTVPATFEEFLALCQTMKDANAEDPSFSPLSNGVADEWDILECAFLGMLPNYVGGAEERAKYESGEKKLNDEAFVAAYTDFAKLAPYLPASFTAVTNTDSQTLFTLERSPMWIDGSWSAGSLAALEVEFDWGTFAIPPPEGNAAGMCFHPDFAMTYNAASPNAEAAKEFLAWMISEEGAPIVANLLPAGFYTMVNLPITLDDVRANEALQLNQGKVLDARFVWPKQEMMDLYAPMNLALIDLLTGAQTPQQVADAMAAQFEQ